MSFKCLVTLRIVPFLASRRTRSVRSEGTVATQAWRGSYRTAAFASSARRKVVSLSIVSLTRQSSLHQALPNARTLPPREGQKTKVI
ncbi:hypothetical protein E2C01_076771 [Portunus trituberculatus]|uniref:Uncharacterized protein n=1 Tax=Portunus trituberculatus TaxID=210409 RepID=A0A5B7IJW3_PORTR|nr:hypothetical protein [Portunus trituberculatus]